MEAQQHSEHATSSHSSPAEEDCPAAAGLPSTPGTPADTSTGSSQVSLAEGLTRVRHILGREDGGLGLVYTQVTVAGWIRTIRFGGKGRLAFINLNDGSSLEGLQIVIDQDKEGFDQLSRSECATGASLMAVGQVVKSLGKGQTVELSAHKITLIGGSSPLEYPLAGKKDFSPEYLREVAHLRHRTNRFSAIMRVRSALSWATHQFFQERGYINVQTPVITCSDCEGAGEMFQVTTLLGDQKIPRTPAGEIDYSQDFFGKPAYLTVSGQLNAEYYACGLGCVYTFGPTFRAEHANTRRHLAEFWMIEPEMAFYDLHDTMDTAEAYVKFCIQHVLLRCKEDLKWLDSTGEKPGLLERLKQVLSTPFARVTYTEAIEKLLQSKAEFLTPVEWGMDLGSEHERYLTEQIYHGPTMVTDYPKQIKAFYMRLNDDGKTVAAMDLLVPHLGELIGGSQREERLDVLLQQFKDHKLPEEPYKAYLDTRRFGSVPHSGFGLGFERLVMFATGVDNIRDVIPFPRYHRHALF